MTSAVATPTPAPAPIRAPAPAPAPTSVPALPPPIGTVCNARAVFTLEGRDWNRSVLRLDSLALKGSLTLSASETLVSKGDRLRVRVSSAPYQHKGKTFLRVTLEERRGTPAVVVEYRRNQRTRARVAAVLDRMRAQSQRYFRTHEKSADHAVSAEHMTASRFGVLMSDSEEESELESES